MDRLVLVLVCVAACSQAARAPRECAPLPTEYQSYEGLYRDCAVHQKARLITGPSRPDFSRLQPLATSTAGCYTAEYQFVVDEKGLPVQRSLRLVRTNSPTYADAIQETLTGLRFEPAKKNGMPVPQLYDFDAKMSYTVVMGGSPSSRRPPPC